jgi:hypothetical protein
MGEPTPNDFEKAAGEKDTSLGREILDLLKHNKKWWLLPILLVLALVGALVILGSTGAAPFIYTLF